MQKPIKLKAFPSGRTVVYALVAATIWCYGVLKLFVFDVDRWLLERLAPDAVWLLNLRIVLVIGVLAAIAVFLRRRGFAFFLAYVVGFPFVILFWIVPILVFRTKSWVARLAIVNAILSLFTDAIYKMIYFVVLSVSLALVVLVGGQIGSTIGLAGLVVCILTSFGKAFRDAFRSPRVLQLYQWAFGLVSEPKAKVDVQRLEVPVSNLPSGEQATAYLTKLQGRVFVNRTCLFLADKLRQYNRSHIHVVGAILSVAGLSALCIFEFSFMYRAVGQIDTSAFGGQVMSAFDYFYTAFDNLMFNTNSSAPLTSVWSQSLSALERVLGVALLAVFAAILIDIRKKRHSDEIDAAVVAGERAGARMEMSVVTDFSYANMQEAMDDLARVENSLYVTILKFMNSLPKQS
jgi:hypothetical protein